MKTCQKQRYEVRVTKVSDEKCVIQLIKVQTLRVAKRIVADAKERSVNTEITVTNLVSREKLYRCLRDSGAQKWRHDRAWETSPLRGKVASEPPVESDPAPAHV